MLEPWQSGAIGGIVGGVVLAALLTVQEPSVLEDVLPQLFGLGPDAVAIGWVIQVSLAAILGVVFIAIVEPTGLDETLDDNMRNAVAGLVYGAVTWLVVGALLVPVWFNAMADGDLSVPETNTTVLVGYLALGVLIGLTYSVLTD